MPVDPNIALGFAPTQGLAPNINIGNALNNVGGFMQLQQQAKAVQSQNALKSILSQPGAIDASGQPTGETMQQVMAVDPATGMKLRQNALVSQEQQVRLGALKTKEFGEKLDLLNDSYGPVMKTYKDAIAGGKTPQQAALLAQQELDETNQKLSQGGLFSEAEVKNHPTKFDPVAFQGFFDNSDRIIAWRKQSTAEGEKQKLDEREDAKLTEEKRYHDIQAGKGEYSNPVEVEYKAPDGTTKRALAQQNKQTGQWQTADETRAALPPGVQPYKQPAPGSTSELRETIKDDVANDPEFKSKSKGDQALEVETRIRVAQGQMSSPAQQHDLAHQIATYQVPPLSGFALARPGGQEVMAEVGKINPDYQSARFNEVNKAMTAFATGKQGDTIRSLNVAVQHLGVIDDAAAALKNGDVRTFNSIGNRIAQELGVSAPTTFDGLKQIVGTEIEKAVAGGIGAVADRDRLMKSLDGANSPEQLAEVSNSFKKLMAGQAMGLKRQYEDATGFKENGPFSFDKKLDPSTTKALGLVKRDEAAREAKGVPALPDKLAALPEDRRAGAIAMLKADPSKAAQFDQVFGEGAAKRVLGDSGALAQAPAAPAGTGKAVQSPIHVTTPQEAMALPPGTFFVAPDGKVRQRAAAAPSAPTN